ncbi:MAG TPA: isoprenylcysteine carboxylmethyltransferase family protein [Xanthobacteraceae bacterium]|nr:isoprenylcysteine carboxylmethyltransferase family protein [Xanthobacteraceae bacterium]
MLPEAKIILAFVTVQRLAELILSARNTGQLRARGAVEFAPGHYPVMVLLHAAWLGGLWIVARDLPANGVLIAFYAALQLLRIWVISALGDRWTTRIIVLPNTPLIRTGPYRFFNHPNYFVVVAEIALLPLVFGLVEYAVIFSILNAVLLLWRIRAEDRALANREGAV